MSALSFQSIHESINPSKQSRHTPSDGTPIKWDANYAHIDGALYEIGRYYKRTGLFHLFFKHRAGALFGEMRTCGVSIGWTSIKFRLVGLQF